MQSIIFLVFLVFLVTPALSELLGVMMISRHGTRAANPTVAQLCPGNADNVKHYERWGISPGGLTGKGMRELYQLGKYTRNRYFGDGKLLPDHYNKDLVWIQAVGDERTIQSGAAWGQAIFGEGTAPYGYIPHLTAPLGIFSLNKTQDNLMEARSTGCKTRLSQDMALWDATKGAALFNESKSARIIDKLSHLCGTDLRRAGETNPELNLGNAFKDVTDALTFDWFSGFDPMPGFHYTQDLYDFRKLAVDNLFGRLYGTEEQRTYMMGSMPQHMKDTFLTLIKYFNDDIPPHPKQPLTRKMWAYHGHRETTYAFKYFFEFDYDYKGPSTPEGAVPPTSTLFFELHAEATTNNAIEFFVRPQLWLPCYEDDHPSNWPRLGPCEAKPLEIGDCGSNCPLDEFFKIIDDRIARTGTWDQLCMDNVQPEAATSAATLSMTLDANAELRAEVARLKKAQKLVVPFLPRSYLFLFSICIAVVACLAYRLGKQRHYPYTRISDFQSIQ